MANLALPTVAAWIPNHHEVILCDENVETIDFDIEADLIGITGFNIQAPKMFEIAKRFREQGKLVAIGGPYASLCPEECEPHADILFVGEAEKTWPQFLSDFENGTCQERYHEKEKTDITTTPIPRWDLLDIKQYGRIPVQTTRGCPFSCEFCDVIIYLGQKVRQKSSEQIAAEIEALYPHLWKAGRDSIFFADDNFIGNKVHAKRTCKMLMELNRSFKRPLRYSTQVTITLARDEELMMLMREAGFHSIFIGIETPRKESLLAMQKRQNTARDLGEDIRIIQSYGFFVWAGMIVGFDADDNNVFEEQLQFINEVNIPISMTGMLNAPANTPLWHRLHKEGRLREGFQYTDQADTNIIPKQMSVPELREGYIRLMKELYSYQNYEKRLRGSIEAIHKKFHHPKKGISWRRAMLNFKRLAKVFNYYLLTADKERRDFFIRIVSQLIKEKPDYLKEGLWHLAVHKHFHEYSQLLEKSQYPSH